MAIWLVGSVTATDLAEMDTADVKKIVTVLETAVVVTGIESRADVTGTGIGIQNETPSKTEIEIEIAIEEANENVTAVVTVVLIVKESASVVESAPNLPTPTPTPTIAPLSPKLAASKPTVKTGPAMPHEL